MGKLNPKNREEAFAYQFEDDVKMLKSVALLGEKEFSTAIGTLAAHIAAYRSRKMRAKSVLAQKKNKERESFMLKNFPTIT